MHSKKISTYSKMRTQHMFFTLIIAFVFFIGGFMHSQVTVQAKAATITPDFDSVDKYIQGEMKEIGIPGLALAIVHDDQIVHQKGFGIADPSGHPVKPQTPFNIASVSKAFTALAVLQLAEAGKIELGAPVQKYLPYFRVADLNASSQITVRDLLNHVSGIPEAAGNDYSERDDTSDFALEKRVRALSAIQLDRPVGFSFEYSNANYDTLGLIVQIISGQPYEMYVQQNIFTPLEMNNSFSSRDEALQHELATGYRMWFGIPRPYIEPAPRSHRPSGNQISSAEDLAHLLIAYLNSGQYQDASVLSESWIREMQNSPVPSGPQCATYSMHWSHSSNCDTSALGLGGDLANFKARILLSPDDRWAVVVLMNTQAFGINGPRQDRIDDGVLDLLQGEIPDTASPHNIQILAGMSLIAFVTMILIVSMIRSITRLKRYSILRSTGFPKVWRHIVFPVVLETLWVIMLVGMVQIATGSRSSKPLSFMLENVPDMAWMIVLSAVITIGWGILRTILTIVVSRKS